MRVPEEVISYLKEKNDFLIATHINPEGDALGSSIALSMALESIGKKVIVYDRDPVPYFYRFLPGHERFTNSISNLEYPIPNLILLDCNDPERAELSDFVRKHQPFIIVIDHHETERESGDLKWIVPNASATGQMIFHLIRALGIDISAEMANNLYTAIAIDTGTFRYSNTDASTLLDASELVRAGAEPALIATALYDTWSRGRFELLILTLNTMEIRQGIAVTVVTKEMFQKTGTDASDTENFANFPRMIADVKISAFFREIEGGWKVSLRSKGDINVAEIAETFSGGGHRNAAGYKIKGDLFEAKEALIREVKRRLV
ncbi:MAG: DHH family phosphoesterase [Thermodesulfovibrionales bacterium]